MGKVKPMTDSEWLELANKLLGYGGKVNNVTRRVFMQRVRKNPDALKKARALFDERGIYYATMKEINQFVADTVSTAREIRTEKYQNFKEITVNETKH